MWHQLRKRQMLHSDWGGWLSGHWVKNLSKSHFFVGFFFSLESMHWWNNWSLHHHATACWTQNVKYYTIKLSDTTRTYYRGKTCVKRKQRRKTRSPLCVCVCVCGIEVLNKEMGDQTPHTLLCPCIIWDGERINTYCIKPTHLPPANYRPFNWRVGVNMKLSGLLFPGCTKWIVRMGSRQGAMWHYGGTCTMTPSGE